MTQRKLVVNKKCLTSFLRNDIGLPFFNFIVRFFTNSKRKGGDRKELKSL